jgi:hypothetical protein
MPDSHDLESGWSVLVAEAAAREAWVDAGRTPETFELQGRIPELAEKLALGLELDPREQDELAQLYEDPECAALLEETRSVLEELEASSPSSSPHLSIVSVDRPEPKEEPVMLNHMPQPMPPMSSGHSTATLVSVALCSAAAAVALFVVLKPAEPPPAPAAAPVTAVIPPIIVPQEIEVPRSCDEDRDEAPVDADVDEAIVRDADEALDQLEQELGEAEVAKLGVVHKVRHRARREGPTNDEEFAGELLRAARKNQYKSPRAAHSLARVSNQLYPTDDAKYVMTFSACRMQDEDKARKAIAGLKKNRQTMVESCRKQGIDLD